MIRSKLVMVAAFGLLVGTVGSAFADIRVERTCRVQKVEIKVEDSKRTFTVVFSQKPDEKQVDLVQNSLAGMVTEGAGAYSSSFPVIKDKTVTFTVSAAQYVVPDDGNPNRGTVHEVPLPACTVGTIEFTKDSSSSYKVTFKKQPDDKMTKLVARHLSWFVADERGYEVKELTPVIAPATNRPTEVTVSFETK